LLAKDALLMAYARRKKTMTKTIFEFPNVDNRRSRYGHVRRDGDVSDWILAIDLF